MLMAQTLYIMMIITREFHCSSQLILLQVEVQVELQVELEVLEELGAQVEVGRM